MKNIPKIVIYIIAPILFLGLISCKKTATNKSTSKSKIQSKTADSLTNAPKTNAKNILNVPKKILVNDNLNTFPPASVSTSFKTNFPITTQLAWTKISHTMPFKTANTYFYKAEFKRENNQNTATYTESGELVESKVKILPEQLPQNIYDAIKKKYTDAQILSAYTYKSTQNSATYFVLIKFPLQLQEKELTIMENGIFAE